MKLEHSFTVPVGVDEAWKILLDIERIGPCMPGAAIDSVDGDDFTGTVKVKLGPIGLTYKGKASFIEKDDATHRAVIDARGRDARGNGTASAKVTATLTGDADSTTVQVATDLDITGKPAQFGRGVMVDVGNKLIGQFADNLSNTISADDGGVEAQAAELDASGVADSAASAAKSVAATSAPAARKRTPKPKQGAAGSSGSESAGSDSAVAQEEQAEDLAAAAGSTGGPIEDAAIEAVGAAPGSFSTPAAGSTATATPTPSANGRQHKPAIPPREVEPINLLESAGPAVAKRLAPVVGVVALVVGVLVWRRRR